MSPYKEHFAQFIQRAEGRLHFAAHSHHYWPDVTRAAQLQAWDHAALRVDQKWDAIFGELIPSLQAQIADKLGLSRPERIAFSSNTHSFVLRLFSSLDLNGTPRILSSDSEFHSFTRQCERYAEDKKIDWEQIQCEPFDSFEDRLLEQVEAGDYDLVFVSQVFFNSGFVFGGMERLAQALANSKALLVIDGYHAFMALPTDLGALEERLFYMAGGYKYAMSGEGVCFMHCPDGFAPRPANTGWFASFGELEQSGASKRVGYGPSGQRFWGATLDPSGMFRMRAVFDWLAEISLDVAGIHSHVRGLQDYFIERLRAGELPWLDFEELISPTDGQERGHFLTFRTERAATLHRRLEAAGIITDYRAKNLRFGFAIYQDRSDVDQLCRRMQSKP